MRQLLLTCREHNQSSSFTWPAETFVLRGGDISKRVICGEIKQSQVRVIIGLAPIFPYTFYHLTHYWFAAADIPV
ncbi:hypothetical protein, partial [Enterobacter asburiae]|uniref:hypothetical protein n=1 Tax=Enterobacter asburiae TaxID=61645 RepID=UPI002074DB9A